MNETMRIYHRYLGYFLAGIMFVYAISGVVLIFRDTDFLKQEEHIEKELAPGLTSEQLDKETHIEDFKVESEADGIMTFEGGTYNSKTGHASYTKKELPRILDRLTHLHKASTDDPLFFLNIFFGVALLFFVVSAFYMFLPGTSIFKKGLYFAAAGVALTLLMLLV